MDHGQKEESEALESLVSRIAAEEDPEDIAVSNLRAIDDAPLTDAENAQAPGNPLRAEVLRNIRLRVKVELGRTRMPLGEALDLSCGSVVDLGKKTGDPVEILVNDVAIARGHVLVVDERFCIRVTEILSIPNPGELH